MTEKNRIYLCLAHMSEAGLEQKYIKEAFDTNWVVPLGPNVNGFEADLEAFVNHTDGADKADNADLKKRVVALSAGTAAVHLALIACGVKAGDEVLVQSFTFCASSHPITYLGVPVILGKNGVERVIELELDPDDRVRFDESKMEVDKTLKIIK